MKWLRTYRLPLQTPRFIELSVASSTFLPFQTTKQHLVVVFDIYCAGGTHRLATRAPKPRAAGADATAPALGAGPGPDAGRRRRGCGRRGRGGGRRRHLREAARGGVHVRAGVKGAFGLFQ